jgi:leucine dehydrogenase
MRAAVRRTLGRADLAGLVVAVQGTGNDGYHLGRNLARDGASLVVADVDEASARRAERDFGARRVAADAIYDVAADVFAPCALGDVLNDETIPRLRCRVVAGGANDQLAEERHAEDLASRGVLFVPDFVINAGGVLGAAATLGEATPGAGDEFAECAPIAQVVESVLARGDEEGRTPHAAAVAMARARLSEARAHMGR